MRMLIALFVCVACGKNTEPPPPSSGSPTAQPESGPRDKKTTPAPTGEIPEQAKQMFATVCATCHGIDGKGNGPAAQSLPTKPRDYTDPAWQASVSDEDLEKTILLGGQGVGKSPLMPGNPQLKDQPEVLRGLVKIIRGFAKQ
jgi:mono/diheme cytochrome c family protein